MSTLLEVKSPSRFCEYLRSDELHKQKKICTLFNYSPAPGNFCTWLWPQG